MKTLIITEGYKRPPREMNVLDEYAEYEREKAEAAAQKIGRQSGRYNPLDAEQIADILGIKKENRVFIRARRGRTQAQEAGLQIIDKLLQDTKTAVDKESVFAYAGIATGYANAMKTYGLMDEKELHGIIGIIEQAGEKAIDRIEKSKSPLSLFQAFSKKAKA